MKKIFNFSFIYLVLGLVAGVFYREFTKINNFEGLTTLKAVHPHLLVLGFVFLLVVLVIDKNFELSSSPKFNLWFILHNVALIYVAVTMTVRGVFQITGGEMAGLNHISGLGHALLGVSLVWFMIMLGKKIAK